MTLRGVFLTSSHPELTARFYSDVAGLPLETVGEARAYIYWKLDDGRMQLAIHEASAFAGYAHPPVAGSNLTHLYFKIEDQMAFLDKIRGLGLTPFAIDEVVVTLVDPDGRKVMFGTA